MGMPIKNHFWILPLIVVIFLQAACKGSKQTGIISSPGDAEAGKVIYDNHCIPYHGPAGVGGEGIGLPLTASAFICEKSDKELLEFIRVGLPVGHPLNSTEVDMPAYGSDPALPENQIIDVVAYLRSILSTTLIDC